MPNLSAVDCKKMNRNRSSHAYMRDDRKRLYRLKMNEEKKIFSDRRVINKK